MKAVTTYVADDGSRHETPEAASARDWMIAQERYIADVANAIRPIVDADPQIRVRMSPWPFVDAGERIAALCLTDPTLFDRLAAAAATIARPVKPGDAP